MCYINKVCGFVVRCSCWQITLLQTNYIKTFISQEMWFTSCWFPFPALKHLYIHIYTFIWKCYLNDIIRRKSDNRRTPCCLWNSASSPRGLNASEPKPSVLYWWLRSFHVKSKSTSQREAGFLFSRICVKYFDFQTHQQGRSWSLSPALEMVRCLHRINLFCEC